MKCYCEVVHKKSTKERQEHVIREPATNVVEENQLVTRHCKTVCVADKGSTLEHLKRRRAFEEEASKPWFFIHV